MMNKNPLHQKKSAICRYFASSGTCYYGDNCQFLHSTDALKNPPQVNKPSNGQLNPVSKTDKTNTSEMMGKTNVTLKVKIFYSHVR